LIRAWGAGNVHDDASPGIAMNLDRAIRRRGDRLPVAGLRRERL